MKLKNKTTGQWDQLYLAGYAAMPELDTVVTAGSQNAVTNAAIKTYVDGRTIPYYDSGYYQTPTSWTIVTDTPQSFEPGRLYLVCPDWVIVDDFYVNSSGVVDSSIDYESTLIVMQNPNDHTQQQTYSMALNTSYDSTPKKVPQYGCDVGLIPYFTIDSGSSETVSLYATLEGRDAQTYLRDYAILDESDVANGTTYYFVTEEWYYPEKYLASDTLHYTLSLNVDGGGGVACLTGDTLIKTIAGDKAIKDIKIGDAVLDAENKPVLVTKTYSHEAKNLIRIVFNNKDNFLATGTHKILTTHGVVKCYGLVKDLEVKRSDGSTFKVMAQERVNLKDTVKVYEIMTETGTYQLTNGVINESEDI